MKRIACLVVVASFCIALSGCHKPEKVFTHEIIPGSHSALTPEPVSADWWMPRHQGVLERNKQGNVNIIFIGDSITHGFDSAGKKVWDKYYAPRGAVNMGFSGDRTQHVLWRFDHGEISGINPKLAVVMIGTNNSHFNSPQQIADGVIAICQRLRTDLPNTKILLLGIFPRTDLPKTNVAQINQEATALFSQIADNKHIFFMNINQKFVGPDGVLRTDLFPDKLHPNEEGYIIWANAIEPEVKKLMGEK